METLCTAGTLVSIEQYLRCRVARLLAIVIFCLRTEVLPRKSWAGLGCHRTRITWLSKARWWPLLGGGGEGGQNTRHQCRGRVAIYQKMTEDALYGLAWFLGSDLGMKEKKSWSQIYSWGQWTLDTAEEEACKVTAARWHQGWVLTAECRGGYWVGLQISNLYLTTCIVVSYV